MALGQITLITVVPAQQCLIKKSILCTCRFISKCKAEADRVITKPVASRAVRVQDNASRPLMFLVPYTEQLINHFHTAFPAASRLDRINPNALRLCADGWTNCFWLWLAGGLWSLLPPASAPNLRVLWSLLEMVTHWDDQKFLRQRRDEVIKFSLEMRRDTAGEWRQLNMRAMPTFPWARSLNHGSVTASLLSY